MPLKKAKSKSRKAVQKVASQNIREMMHGPRYKKVAKRLGVKKARKMVQAASFNAARGGKRRGRRKT